MQSLVSGDISAPVFAQSWLAARRRALNDGERVREKFDQALDEVFYALEDYAIDPDLRDPGDLSDDQLVAIVQDALNSLSRL
jgi:Bacterial self-protective colicin-like immunity